jgi:hypothetical protein
MDEDARLAEMTSCQRALAFMAAAAWNRLTFTGNRSATAVPNVEIVDLQQLKKMVGARCGNHYPGAPNVGGKLFQLRGAPRWEAEEVRGGFRPFQRL